MAQGTTLEGELAYFEEHKAEYLERFPGLFVLIKGEEMVGPFPGAEDAYAAGLSRYGLEPFLVRQVLEEEPVGYAPVFFATVVPDGR